MNNKIIVLWGVIIILFVLGIYYIGETKKEDLFLSKYDSVVKEASISFIENEQKELPYTVTSEQLEDKGYLKEKIAFDDKICIANITINSKEKIEINYSCKK